MVKFMKLKRKIAFYFLISCCISVWANENNYIQLNEDESDEIPKAVNTFSVPDAPILDPIAPTWMDVTLVWSAVANADLYSLCRHSSLITELNGSVTLVAHFGGPICSKSIFIKFRMHPIFWFLLFHST